MCEMIFQNGDANNVASLSAPFAAQEQGNIFNYPCGHVTYCNIGVHVDSNEDRISRDRPSCRQNVQEFKIIYPSGFQQ